MQGNADTERAVTVNTRYEWNDAQNLGYRGQIAVSGLVVWESELFLHEYQAQEAAEEHFVESLRRLFNPLLIDGAVET